MRPTRPGAALRRLADPHPFADDAAESVVVLPLLLRAPALVGLWAVTLLTAVAVLGFGRLRVPAPARGVVVSAQEHGRPTPVLLFLAPVTMRDRLTAGQVVHTDTGTGAAALLRVAALERDLLDARRVRARFRDPATLLLHVATPKVVARLAECGDTTCLTAPTGVALPAVVGGMSRTVASYVIPGL